MGNNDFVNTLRIKFAKEQGLTFDNIEKALAAGDLQRAFLLAHTLKGSAGLIAEPELVEAAKAVEIKLKDKGAPDADMMQRLGAVFTRVLEAIEIPEKQDAGEIDLAVAADVFNRLQPILEASSADCFMMLDELEKLPLTDELVAAIEICDFKAALEALGELRMKLEI